MIDDLFTSLREAEPLMPGAVFLPGAARNLEADMIAQLHEVVTQAPLRRLETPGGRSFSVEMTNCGILGWYSDRAGYRYESHDPLSGLPWPPMPESWRNFACEMAARAGFESFSPQTCLINCYAPGARMGLHQDRDETALESPIVSVSLGIEAQFLFGGLNRSDKTRKLRLQSGDVVVWGKASRLVYHGIAPLKADRHVLTGARRWNLTFRRVQNG